MKITARLFLITLFLLLSGSGRCAAQARIYTRTYLLSDFSSTVMKVVLSGNSMMDMCLREAVSSGWTLSPYEFCRPDDFDEVRKDPLSYVMSVVSAGGLVFLSIDKGGREDDKDTRNHPFNLAKLPVATSENFDSRDFSCLPVWLDIFQDYIQKACKHEKSAWAGLSYRNRSKLPENYTILSFEPSHPAKGDLSCSVWFDSDSHILWRYFLRRFDGKRFK